MIYRMQTAYTNTATEQIYRRLVAQVPIPEGMYWVVMGDQWFRLYVNEIDYGVATVGKNAVDERAWRLRSNISSPAHTLPIHTPLNEVAEELRRLVFIEVFK